MSARNAHARTFAEFFARRASTLENMEISTFSARGNVPDLCGKGRKFSDPARPAPDRTEEIEDREIRAYVASMMGGTRTIAPHPNRVRTLHPMHHESNREMRPREHAPRRDPGVAQPIGKARYVGDDAELDKAKKLKDARDHVAALRDTLAMAEARLARMER